MGLNAAWMLSARDSIIATRGLPVSSPVMSTGNDISYLRLTCGVTCNAYVWIACASAVCALPVNLSVDSPVMLVASLAASPVSSRVDSPVRMVASPVSLSVRVASLPVNSPSGITGKFTYRVVADLAGLMSVPEPAASQAAAGISPLVSWAFA
jgi:hypothetical protein